MSERESMPSRRLSETFKFNHRWPDDREQIFLATIGFYSDGRVGEVWLATDKMGTTLDVSVKDSAMIISVGLQHGAQLDEFTNSFIRDSRGEPGGPIGSLIDILLNRRPPIVRYMPRGHGDFYWRGPKVIEETT